MSDTHGGGRESMSLAGHWQFRLDPDKKGVAEQWYRQRLDETVQLPGTTDENGKGDYVDERCEDRLSRIWRWIGAAWYQQHVTVPTHWADKHVALFLERTKNTRVWVDETYVGSEDSLSAPHVYDLSSVMTPGEHTISILIDNSKLPPVGPCHAVDERTQTNWNGIIGRIGLDACEPFWLEDLQAFPDVEGRTVEVKGVIRNTARWCGHCDLIITVACEDSGRSVAFKPLTDVPRIDGPATVFRARYTLGPDAPLWDEFHPHLLRLTAALEVRPSATVLRDEATVTFGLRRFGTRRSQLTVNGRPIFLRGKHDACIFPLTGYPPMDKGGWLRVLGIAKNYGINHYRFHSWCPPEAAFAAADELGMYIQAELPNKAAVLRPKAKPYVLPTNAFETQDEVNADEAPAEEDNAGYLRREGEKILKAFGNHPSFVMMTLGNEIGGDRDVMKSLCDHFRAMDARHLYAQGSNHFHWEPGLQEGDEFWVTGTTAHDLPVRGSFFGGKKLGHVDSQPPSTTVDFCRSIAGVPVPVVGHETGQYQVSPDFGEIPRYTGVLRARNLEIFRERLKAAGMLDQADAFVRASGALSVICYREDIEAALRTAGFGGFQLLDLQDFPGQGTALVGILNAFMESKGLITPERWREFCCDVVPLLRMTKYTWTTAETFAAGIRVAHYGQSDLRTARVAWALSDASGSELQSGTTSATTIRQGNLNELDLIAFPLHDVAAPCKLDLRLSIPGTPYQNRYPLWVYPSGDRPHPHASVRICRQLDATAQALLAEGGSVLLLPELEALSNAIMGSFQCDFWCWPMFRRAALRAGIEVAPGTLGILCDPEHAALAQFPTASHSDWQWWHLVKNSRPIILDKTPNNYRPLVQVIDNFARNHKLGVLFEAHVNGGKLLVCSIDLPGLQDHPEARQFMHSLTAYMHSDAFEPTHNFDVALIEDLLTTKEQPEE